MLRLFEPIIGKSKANSLFTGDHTFTVVSSKPAKSAGGYVRSTHISCTRERSRAIALAFLQTSSILLMLEG
eukprot:SAG31_NODE_2571_length_5459_cov_7.139925_4_plen_71_part_00